MALVPQSIESIKEFQIVTQLWDAELGRSVGSQVCPMPRSVIITRTGPESS